MKYPTSNEPIFSVDESSDLPIWVQLRNRIAYLIRVGFYEPGQQIPSIRSLSTSAKINYTTVAKAYKDLEHNGMIVSVRGRGMYVQKNIKHAEDSAEVAVDIMVEDCVKRYRSAGMKYDEIRVRMRGIIAELEEATLNAAEEKKEYYDA